MNDLVFVDPRVALERAADPGKFVVMALEHVNTWLAEALACGDLDDVRNAKGYAVTLETAVKEQKLGKEAQLSATELVRRAERCIGLGIRAGQAAGEIYSQHDNITPGRIGNPQRTTDKRSVTEFATRRELASDGHHSFGIYDLVDGVSGEQFESAISEGRTEEDLTRANLARKLESVRVKPVRVKPVRPPDRSEWHHNKRRIDPERIVEQTVIALEGLTLGLNMISIEDISSLDAEKRLIWSQALEEPLTAITRLKRGLRG